MPKATTRPPIQIGWLAATNLDDEQRALLDGLADDCLAQLSRQFPEFAWNLSRLRRPIAEPIGPLDPLTLLELGAEEKLHQHLDLVLVFVPNELIPRNRPFVTGVPSSILEVAVLSSARFMDTQQPQRHLLGLALHLLGHLLGLAHEEEGVMRLSDEAERLEAVDFSAEARTQIRQRLARIADQRVEEQGRRRPLAFWWRTWLADPWGIVSEIFAYAPWRMPLYLGRFTAATAVTVIFLFLSAEAWELGAKLAPGWLLTSALLAVVLAALSVYLGQNLHQMGRVANLREQLIRTRTILFGALLSGMGALWVVLFLIALTSMSLFPKAVFAGWAGVAPEALSLSHFAALMATLGVVAGAFGGNLEDEEEIKAVLLFDEEA